MEIIPPIYTNRPSGSELREGTEIWFIVLIKNVGDEAAPPFIDIRDERGNVLDRAMLSTVPDPRFTLDPGVMWQGVVSFKMPTRNITVRIVVGHFTDDCKIIVDDNVSDPYSYIYIPPPPADIVLESYSWKFIPDATFPYHPEDIREVWQLTYTIKNVGEQPGSAVVALYLRNAPAYIPELHYREWTIKLSPGSSLTRRVNVPETKGNEYYVLEVTTLETGITKSYEIGPTPETPETGPITPPPPEEIPPAKPKPLWPTVLPIIVGATLYYTSTQR